MYAGHSRLCPRTVLDFRRMRSPDEDETIFALRAVCVPATKQNCPHSASSIGARLHSHPLHLHLRVIAQHAQAPAHNRNVAADARAARVDELRILLRKCLCFHTLMGEEEPPHNGRVGGFGKGAACVM